MLNDIMQSLLTSLYPLLKENYALDFVQIGLLTMAFQVTASLLQPAVGIVTDRWPMPFASDWHGQHLRRPHHAGLRAFFPGPGVRRLPDRPGFGDLPSELPSRGLPSGGRHGLAQSMFQVGGNKAGTALGPLLAAFIVLFFGQTSVAWFSAIALSA